MAIEGQGGDTRTYKLAARMADLGVSQEMAVEIMEPWNEACDPPWGPEEFEAKVAQGYLSRQNEIGCDAPRTAAEEFGGEVPADWLAGERKDTGAQDAWQARVASFRGRSPAEGEKLPPLDYWDNNRRILPKMLEGSVGIVFGPPGAFKSAILGDGGHALPA